MMMMMMMMMMMKRKVLATLITLVHTNIFLQCAKS